MLHVVPWLARYGATELRPAAMGDAELRSLQDQGTLALEIFREKYFSGICSHHEVQCGAVAETITDRARSLGCGSYYDADARTGA